MIVVKGIAHLSLKLTHMESADLYGALLASDVPGLVALARAMETTSLRHVDELDSHDEVTVFTSPDAQSESEALEDDDYDRHLTGEERIERAVEAMCETQPTWGYRMMRVWGALGHDFGDADSFDWSLQREMIRLFSHDVGAVEAVQNGNYDYPALGSVIR